MAENWPADLPQCFLDGTVNLTLGDGRLRTPTDAGPAKSRLRSSAVSDFVTGDMKMTRDQKNSLMTFFKTTVLQGDPFNFPDFDAGPTSGGTDILVRFGNSVPSGQKIGGGYWIMSIELEILP